MFRPNHSLKLGAALLVLPLIASCLGTGAPPAQNKPSGQGAQGAPGGQAPGGRRAVDDPARPGLSPLAAGPHSAPPPGIVRPALADREPSVLGGDGMAVGPGPGQEVDPEMRVAPGHLERGAGREGGQGPVDEDVGAAVEAEVLKVDSRAQR